MGIVEIPATARVKSSVKGAFNEKGGQRWRTWRRRLRRGRFEAQAGGLKGYMRGRVLPYLPIAQDFEKFSLDNTNAIEGAAFAYPPLPWIGARFKFEIRDLNETRCWRRRWTIRSSSARRCSSAIRTRRTTRWRRTS